MMANIKSTSAKRPLVCQYMYLPLLPLSLTNKGWSIGHSAIISTLLLSGTLCGDILSLRQEVN